jgi:hypothetical protein
VVLKLYYSRRIRKSENDMMSRIALHVEADRIIIERRPDSEQCKSRTQRDEVSKTR